MLIEIEIDPIQKARLEDHWTGLLRDYETACDQVVTGEAAVLR